jgi:hypothetical protein
MPRPAKQDGQDRAGRTRVNKRRQGMRLLRIWVPDPAAPGFRDEAKRQAALLRGVPEAAAALAFIESAMEATGDYSAGGICGPIGEIEMRQSATTHVNPAVSQQCKAACRGLRFALFGVFAPN